MHGLTLVFDLDGTLVDTAPDLIGAANHVLTSRGLEPLMIDDLRPSISFGARHILATALTMRGRPVNERELDLLLGQFLDHYAGNIAVHSQPFAGLSPLLEDCLAKGVRLGVCTNKREDLSRLLLTQLDLLRLFGGLAGRDTFPVCKPHPDHLLGAIRLAGGDPARAVMVGDSEVDVATAKAAGVPVIGVTFGYTQIPVTELGCDAVIDSYDQFPAALAALTARR
jgi:phosphoglycolate phosphatase